MKIHSDTLKYGDLVGNAPLGVYVDAATRGSRKRDHGFDVSLQAEPGSDAHGIKRCYARNSGQFGAVQGFGRAATYIEWGDWMAELFKLDPTAIIGPYDGAGDFIAQTAAAATWRPKRENVAAHAERWADELSAAEAV